MAKNKHLHAAKVGKMDEFYTQLSDVENELKNYTEHFADKVVLCNCDDPDYSSFHRYFRRNFKRLGLRELITTHFKPDGSPSYAQIITREWTQKNPDFADLSYEDRANAKHQNAPIKHKNVFALDAPKRQLDGNGDFRSKECREYLKRADIVVTNPPFSLFRDFVSLLFEYEKSFLIIGNVNAISYNEIFARIKNNELWLGHPFAGRESQKFFVPDHYELYGQNCGVEDGQKYIFIKGLPRWLTNLPHKKRQEFLETIAKYDPAKYPKYDNYEAINVNKTIHIPLDYEGVMGVPLTFLDKYNPAQFEIIGKMSTTTLSEDNFGYPYINGKKIYARILIRNKNPRKNKGAKP